MALSEGDIMLEARARRLQASIPTAYTLYKSGSTYYADTNIIGGTDYEGTAAATVIQNAYDAMDSGSVLFFKEGEYPLGTGDPALLLDDNGKWGVGEGYYNTILSYTGTGTAVQVGSTSAVKQWSGLRNLKILGDASTAIGLDVIQRNGRFYNVCVEAVTAGIGLRVRSPASGFSTYYCDFYSLHVLSCKNGVQILGNATKQTNANHFLFGEIDGYNKAAGSIGVDIDESDTDVFYGVPIGDFVTGIDIDANSNDIWFDQVRMETITDGIVVAGDDCRFSGSVNVSGNKVADTGSGNQFDLRQYVVKNSGTSTGTGAEQTIAHGCNFTPTEDEVFLSERTTGGALAIQSSAPDATNIYITATNAKDYNWKIEKA